MNITESALRRRAYKAGLFCRKLPRVAASYRFLDIRTNAYVSVPLTLEEAVSWLEWYTTEGEQE